MFLDVNLNLLVLQRGNLLMSTVVLTLGSSIALWMFDFPTMVWIYTTWQISGFLRFLPLAELYTKRLQTLSVSGLTELQNSLERWRLAALIYLFSEQNGCWLLLWFFECMPVLSAAALRNFRCDFFPSGAFMYHISLFSRRLLCLIAKKNGEHGWFISSGRWSRKSL